MDCEEYRSRLGRFRQGGWGVDEVVSLSRWLSNQGLGGWGDYIALRTRIESGSPATTTPPQIEEAERLRSSHPHLGWLRRATSAAVELTCWCGIPHRLVITAAAYTGLPEEDRIFLSTVPMPVFLCDQPVADLAEIEQSVGAGLLDRVGLLFLPWALSDGDLLQLSSTMEVLARIGSLAILEGCLTPDLIGRSLLRYPSGLLELSMSMWAEQALTASDLAHLFVNTPSVLSSLKLEATSFEGSAVLDLLSYNATSALSHLSLSRCRLTSSQLLPLSSSALNRVQTLDLSRNSLDDALLDHLPEFDCPSLETLHVYGNCFSSRCINDFLRSGFVRRLRRVALPTTENGRAESEQRGLINELRVAGTTVAFI